MNIQRGRRCLLRDVICSQICRSETSCREALAGVLLGSFAMVGSQGREGKMETIFATSTVLFEGREYDWMLFLLCEF
jgi:hypothetical protein